MRVNCSGRKGQLDVLDLGGQIQLVLGHPGGLPTQHEVQRSSKGEHINAFVLREVRAGRGEEQLGCHKGRGATVCYL